MNITKAVITAAGNSHSNLPLQSLVDRRGQRLSVLRCMLDEVVDAGIEEVAIIVRPGQSDNYLAAAGSHAGRLVFCEQDNPRGYGDALLRAADFADDHAFLHLVSDHLYVSRHDVSCAAQLCRIAAQNQCSVSAIQPTRENEIIRYGTVGGSPVAQQDGLYQISTVIEKPTPTVAEQELVVAGQRAGHYLCLFGMHVLTPAVFHLLRENLNQAGPDGSIDLSSALAQLADTEQYLAYQVEGARYDISYKYGLLMAQLAISLGGDDRDEILTGLVGLLADN